MKVSVYYTVISVLDLIAFMIVVACLPAEVPIHYAHGGMVDRLGSPWVYLAMPAVSALISLAVWAVRLKGKKTALPTVLLVVAGGLFSVLGWIFLGLGAQNALFGEEVRFPYAALTALPISYLIMACGVAFPETLGEGEELLFEVAFVAAGGASAIVSMALICVDPALGWVAMVVCGAALLAAVGTVFLKKRLAKKS